MSSKLNKTNIAVIIAAAGKASRINRNINKTLLKIENKTVLEHSIEAFLKYNQVKQIIVTYNDNDLNEYQYLIDGIKQKYSFHKINLIEGGEKRSESVLKAIKNLEEEYDYLMIHDAARPFMPSWVFDKFLKEIKEKEEAIIPYVTVQDTTIYDMKAIDRELLMRIQTPQCFSKRVVLKIADLLENSEVVYKDESTALLTLRERIDFVKSSEFLNKITYPRDYIVAKEMYKLFKKLEYKYSKDKEEFEKKDENKENDI